MQDTEHGSVPETAVVAVRAALSGGRPAEARAQATEALERYGPDPALYTLLGRAHAAEDEDDHDDAAERAYRRGLEAFPDDLGLLTAYAELCLDADPLDRPGRHARGSRLTARITELAPGSPQAAQLDQQARGRIIVLRGPDAPTAALTAHIQRHDVRAALATAPDLPAAAHLAQEEAFRFPYDRRLAIRAETLTALTRPGGRLLLAHVRAPLATLLTVSVVAAVALVTRYAVPLPEWTGLVPLLLFAPGMALRTLEHGARTRALSRLLPPPDDEPLPDSPLPPPPALGLAELGTSLAVFALALGAGFTPLLWTTPEDPVYPHYTATAPKTFRGAPLLSALPEVDDVDSDMAAMGTPDIDEGQAFTFIYGTLEETAANNGPAAYVMGSTGDWHDAPTNAVKDFQMTLSQSDSTINRVWDPAPGSLGGRMHCVAYATDAEAPGSHVACTWLDRGSMGTVVMNEPALDDDTAAASARALREAILHEQPSDGARASGRHLCAAIRADAQATTVCPGPAGSVRGG